MLAQRKPDMPAGEVAAPGPRWPDAAMSAQARVSPVHELQQRLAEGLVATRRPSAIEMLGLGLITLLSTWVAGVFLYASL